MRCEFKTKARFGRSVEVLWHVGACYGMLNELKLTLRRLSFARLFTIADCTSTTSAVVLGIGGFFYSLSINLPQWI